MSKNDETPAYPKRLKQTDNPLLEPSPYREDGGELIGRDPKTLNTEELVPLEHKSPLKAIRACCLDCSGRPSEVRKCKAIDCQLWPFRMGTNPFDPRSKPRGGNKLQECQSASSDAAFEADGNTTRLCAQEHGRDGGT